MRGPLFFPGLEDGFPGIGWTHFDSWSRPSLGALGVPGASDVGLKYMATSFSFAWLDPPKSVLHRYLATSGRLGSAGRSWFLLAGVVI